MTISVNVTNAGMDEGLFNQFCFMLQMAASGSERTDEGVRITDIPAADPVLMPGYEPPIVTVETFYRRKIRQVCERTAALWGWPFDPHDKIRCDVIYRDFCAAAILDELKSEDTGDFPKCAQRDCPSAGSCYFSPDKIGVIP